MIVNSSSIFHCPGRNCENVIKMLDDKLLANNRKDNEKRIGRNLECECGYTLCLNCLLEGHKPMRCDIYK